MVHPARLSLLLVAACAASCAPVESDAGPALPDAATQQPADVVAADSHNDTAGHGRDVQLSTRPVGLPRAVVGDADCMRTDFDAVCAWNAAGQVLIAGEILTTTFEHTPRSPEAGQGAEMCETWFALLRLQVRVADATEPGLVGQVVEVLAGADAIRSLGCEAANWLGEADAFAFHCGGAVPTLDGTTVVFPLRRTGADGDWWIFSDGTGPAFAAGPGQPLDVSPAHCGRPWAPTIVDWPGLLDARDACAPDAWLHTQIDAHAAGLIAENRAFTPMCLGPAPVP